jgi:Secretion system C-terminal sorting domain
MKKYLFILISIITVCSACQKNKCIYACIQPWDANCNAYDSTWQNKDSSLIIYPNPVSTTLEVRLNYPEKKGIDYEIFAIQGTSIKKGIAYFTTNKTHAETTIVITDLAVGIYLLVLKANGKNIVSEKFVKL